MSGGYSAIDLARLPAPRVVEALDFETVLAALMADVATRWPEFDALLESDPAVKVLEVAAYREVLLRQRVNDAARACMLAYAQGADLDNLAALLGVARNLLDPGDPGASPPVAATWEDDESLRRRVPLSLEGLSTAGPSGAYIFHALSVPGVKSVAVASPAPGEVLVTVLGMAGDGTPAPGLLDAVAAVLGGADVRPLTDQVTVAAATVVPYVVEATVYTYAGPDPAVVLDAAREAVLAVADAGHRLGRDMPLSALYAALHREGVQRVELASPGATVAVGPGEAPWCSAVTLTLGGVAGG